MVSTAWPAKAWESRWTRPFRGSTYAVETPTVDVASSAATMTCAGWVRAAASTAAAVIQLWSCRASVKAMTTARRSAASNSRNARSNASRRVTPSPPVSAGGRAGVWVIGRSGLSTSGPAVAVTIPMRSPSRSHAGNACITPCISDCRSWLSDANGCATRTRSSGASRVSVSANSCRVPLSDTSKFFAVRPLMAAGPSKTLTSNRTPAVRLANDGGCCCGAAVATPPKARSTTSNRHRFIGLVSPATRAARTGPRGS